VLAAKALQSLGERPDSEIGTSADDQPRRLATGVGINHSNTSAVAIDH
jgi:hypothetical protein